MMPALIVSIVVAASLGIRPGEVPAQSSPPGTKALLEEYGFKVVEENGRQVVELTLAKTLELTLERNISLESFRVGESIAQSALAATQNRFTPTLTNTMEYERGLAPSLFFSSGTDFANLLGTDTITLSSELSKPLENGIEYGLTYSESRTRAISTSIANEGDNPAGIASGEWLEISKLKGSVTIPIYQDYGQALNNIPTRRGVLDLSGSRLSIRGRELNLLELSALTYWDLVVGIENVKVQEDAVKLSEQLLRDNRQRLKTGVLSPFDVQVNETQLAREREQLLNARSTVARVEDGTRAILNLEIADLVIRPLDRPRVRTREFQFEDLLKKVYASNPDLRILRNSQSSNNLDLEEARNLDEPDLDLELSYTLTGYSSDPFQGTSGFTQNRIDGYEATLTWTVPLFDVATLETIHQRLLERKQVELQIANLKFELKVRLQGVLRQIRLAREEVDTAGVAKRLAEEQLKNEIVRIQVGESTSFQVAQFQQDASTARVREILARVRYERVYLSLLVLSGEIFDMYGLTPTFQ